MTTNTTVVHPVTGEVLDDPAALAREWARLDDQITAARRDLRELEAARDALDPAIREAAHVLGRVDAGDRWVVLVPPPRRPAQRVDIDACRRYQEVLTALGVGRVITEWRPPTAADVRANAAAIVANGINVDELLPAAPAARMDVQLVPKAAA